MHHFVVGTAEDESSDGVPAGCIDPYRTPGYLLIPPRSQESISPTAVADTSYRTTRWIPFYGSFHDLPPPPEAVYPRTSSSPNILHGQSEIEDKIIASAPTSWMRKFLQFYRLTTAINASKKAGIVYNLSKDELDLVTSMNWVKNRRVLLVGDSVDRIAVLSFCQDLGLSMKSEGGPVHGKRQTTVYCHVPGVNFTLVQWHVPSMFTYRPDWWWEKNMTVVPFEQRLTEIYSKYSLPITINAAGRAPDLILVQTGFWDERAFRSGLHEEKEKNLPELLKTKMTWESDSQLAWNQLRFVNARLQRVVAILREIYGPDVPMMYRSMTTRKDSKQADLGMLSLDRMHRSMATHLGLEVFDWSRIVYGHSSEYKDQLHVHAGPLTWVFDDMLLSYLFRAAGGIEDQGKVIHWPSMNSDMMWQNGLNWQRCHAYLKRSENR
ncbi:uncharacterized protein V2V93DRAFT_327581 [Kockiozyma suomiensis]|uniref:uncharacterized protein n=1 Tax=Kockiozyma suomiensis TaxID=1337062 RepID=UPI00334348FF